MSELIKRKNFTIASNAVINDKNLSYKAKGIYLYLCSRPDGWKFYLSEIAKQSSDGESSVRSGIKELEDFGYLDRHRFNDPQTGKINYNYEIYETPSGKKQALKAIEKSCDQPCAEKPHAVKPMTVKSKPNNTIQYNNTDNNNTDNNNIPPKSPKGEESADKEKLLEEQSSELYSHYPRKTARGQAIVAIKRALKKESFDVLLESVKEYSSCVGKWDDDDKKYIPHPSTWFNGERWLDDRATWRAKIKNKVNPLSSSMTQQDIENVRRSMKGL